MEGKGDSCAGRVTVDVGSVISRDVLGFGVEVWGIECVVWGFIGDIFVIFGVTESIGGVSGFDSIIGDIGGVVWGIEELNEGMGVVLAGNDAVVWGFGKVNVGMGVVLGGTDAVVGGLSLSRRLSGWMKVSQLTFSGPPISLVIIRQLCRKLTGSSG